jgi:hypothetical protein
MTCTYQHDQHNQNQSHPWIFGTAALFHFIEPNHHNQWLVVESSSTRDGKVIVLLLPLQWAAAKGSKRKALVRGAQDASNTGPSWQPDKFSGGQLS